MRGLLALLGLACVLTAGCDGGITGDRGDAREGGSVLVGLSEPPDSLDPALAGSPQAIQALWLAYTPPMTYRRAEGAKGTRLVAGLAESAPESQDADTTFRFRLRKGLRYSDGRPVLAGDFQRAVARSVVLNPKARLALGGIRGVDQYAADPRPRQAIDGIQVNERERTVRIELTAPDPEFPEQLATLWTAPVPPGTATRDLSRTPPAGVGPYRLEGPARGRSYILSRVRDFRLASVPAGKVDSVAGTVVRSRGRRTTQTLEGLLDITQGEPPALRLPQIRSEYKSRYREFATLTSRLLIFDLDTVPFTDPDVRRAVSFALDLRALARLESGFLRPSCNVIPSSVAGYSELDPCPYGTREGDSDLVRAETLVRRSSERRRRVLVDGGPGPRAGAGRLRRRDATKDRPARPARAHRGPAPAGAAALRRHHARAARSRRIPPGRSRPPGARRRGRGPGAGTLGADPALVGHRPRGGGGRPGRAVRRGHHRRAHVRAPGRHQLSAISPGGRAGSVQPMPALSTGKK